MNTAGRQTNQLFNPAIITSLAVALLLAGVVATRPWHLLQSQSFVEPSTSSHGSASYTAPTPQDWNNAINAQRQAAGLAPLQLDARLNASAAEKSASLNAEGIINGDAHVDSHGFHGDQYIQQNWPACIYGGENIVWGAQSISQAVSEWMNSPEHKANILDPHYTHTGFSTNGIYTTEHFCGIG